MDIDDFAREEVYHNLQDIVGDPDDIDGEMIDKIVKHLDLKEGDVPTYEDIDDAYNFLFEKDA